jgi:hypothetical protein
VEPYFLVAQRLFVDHEAKHYSGASKLTKVSLECSPWRKLHDESNFTIRNFAGTTEDGRIVVVAPEIVELPEASVAAIIAHEFGHAYDSLYPGRWVMAGGELVRFDDVEEDSPRADQARLARMRAWRDRDPDTVETMADQIAEEVVGLTIRYSGPCVLQTFDRAGTKRPKGLR